MSDIKKYTIEVHGDSDVLYQDRNSGMHGLNLVTLTDKAFNCDFEHLESLLNKGEQYDKLTSRVEELEAALNEAFEISERSNEQNPSNFDQELAMEHNEDICEIYYVLKELKDGE